MLKILRHLFLGTTAIVIAGCSMQLTQSDLENIPQTTERYSFFGNIPFIFGGDTLELDHSLLRAYTAAASAEAFPRERCRGDATIQAFIQQNKTGSAWSLGAILIPVWPILPVDETWTYTLTARIFCDGALVSHIEFQEEDVVKAILWGRLRADLATKASRQMHRKLVQRLAFELENNRPTDLNIASDF